MNSHLTVEQNNCIEKIAQNERISDYELEVNSGTVKGDGYLGILSIVNLISESKKLNLAMKTAETNDEFRKKMVIRKAYLREIYIYNKILPAFENFQRKRNLQDPFRAFAKIYGSCEEDRKEFLILENLKEAGYKLWNRKVHMNAEHLFAVLVEYGKFHAVSLAMKDQNPEMFEDLTRNLGSIFENSYSRKEFEQGIKSTLDKGFKAVKGNDYATEALRKYSETIGIFLMKELQLPENNIVINHGDCWSNNMMFKYEDTANPQKPTKVCLLDWQLAKIGSPVLDLSYFLFVCSSKAALYDYKTYLKVYHETVSESLRQLCCDPEKVFPYSLLERHWKQYSKFGLYMAIVVVTVMLSEVEEVPELKDIMKNQDTILDCFNYDGIHVKEYNQRILDIVTFMSEHDLI